ncbi:hypothetical protein [Amycolatopsis sp. H20-H5]|uniref:hypothetical protein n=1 Tax=Amycolatopsis sp. H20-H5 TaxID=3046309 RepID=UPI002DB9CDC7|nr:hypothetical protein [Amycolatopsis sp. H20-H5]MEC3980439.1 hypothetical protein [Amycolatopsis sp. H20-H5]
MPVEAAAGYRPSGAITTTCDYLGLHFLDVCDPRRLISWILLRRDQRSIDPWEMTNDELADR